MRSRCIPKIGCGCITFVHFDLLARRLEYACAHIIILAEISSENLLLIRADFVTERDIGVPARIAHAHNLRTCAHGEFVISE